jgi:hypothetical protein
VAIRGLLSYVVQHATQRAADRTERERQVTALAESRRAERLALVERFVQVAAEAERCAFGRPPDWTDGDAWHLQTQSVMDRLWVAERLVRLLFPPGVHDAARAYFLDLNQVVWHGLPGGSIREHLEANRLAFLDAARPAIG